MRSGIPIEEFALQDTVKTDIELSPLMQEWESAFAANLDLYMWETDRYPADFKARVIAWHSRHQELELHRQDAINRAVKRRK